MSCSPADQAAQHIASSLVGGQDTVADHECSRADMIRDQADRHILLRIDLIFRPCDLADPIPDGLHGIDVKHSIHILHHYGQTLQPHAGINIFLRQLRVVPMSVIVELREHIVPYFHKAVALASHLTVGLSAAVLDTSVVVNLGTGTAGTCAVLPEIIAFSVLVPIEAGDF